MKEKLKKITNKEVLDIIADKDALKHIKEKGVIPLEVRDVKSNIKNNLIELEIAFRKCDRFGVFE